VSLPKEDILNKSATDPRFSVLPVVKHRFFDAFNACVGKVQYRLGSKPCIGSSPGYDFRKSDCSGFVRWIMSDACLGVNMPLGSFLQGKWCYESEFKEVKYAEVAKLKDNRLRIAFIKQEGVKYGHVWLVLNGLAYQCCSGKGVSSTLWNSDYLLKNVDFCYVLTDPLR